MFFGAGKVPLAPQHYAQVELRAPEIRLQAYRGAQFPLCAVQVSAGCQQGAQQLVRDGQAGIRLHRCPRLLFRFAGFMQRNQQARIIQPRLGIVRFQPDALREVIARLRKLAPRCQQARQIGP